MKVSDAIAAFNAITALANSGKPLPVKFAYAAARNSHPLGDAAKAYEASRQTLLRQYGKKGAAGELLVVAGHFQLEDPDAFNAAIEKLNETDLEDLKLHQVALEEFPKDIDLVVMGALLPMVKESEG